MFRNLLIGLDDSEAARAALVRAIDMARESRGRIGLLVAAPRLSAWIWAAPFAVPCSPADLAAQLDATVCRSLDRAERLVPADVPVTRLVVHAPLGEALLTHASDGLWDLVVVANEPPRRRWARRRDVRRLLRSSPVPVLVLRGESAEGLPGRAGLKVGIRTRVDAAAQNRTPPTWRRGPGWWRS